MSKIRTVTLQQRSSNTPGLNRVKGAQKTVLVILVIFCSLKNITLPLFRFCVGMVISITFFDFTSILNYLVIKRLN